MDSCTEPKETCYNVHLKHLENFDANNKTILKASIRDTLQANEYGIILKGTAKDDICLKKVKKAWNLYAFTFNNEEIIFKDKALNISIISSSDINNEYPAGKELKTIFMPIGFEPNCYGINTENDSDCFVNYFLYEGIYTLEQAYNELFAHNYYLNKNENTATITSLFLIKPEITAYVNLHQFTIEIDYQSGRKEILTTPEVVLK